MTFLYIVGSALVISLASLIGIFTLSMKESSLNKIILKMVALSSGALLGGAFIHLIPEGLEKTDASSFFYVVLISILTYLIIEKVLHWRH